MTVMFVTVLMVMELFLFSCFKFWFSDNYEAIFNKFSNFFSLKLSGFWLTIRSAWRAWRRFSHFLIFLLFVLRLEVGLFVIFSLFIVSAIFSFSSTPAVSLVISWIGFFIIFIFRRGLSWCWIDFFLFFWLSLFSWIYLSDNRRNFRSRWRLWNWSWSMLG